MNFDIAISILFCGIVIILFILNMWAFARLMGIDLFAKTRKHDE